MADRWFVLGEDLHSGDGEDVDPDLGRHVDRRPVDLWRRGVLVQDARYGGDGHPISGDDAPAQTGVHGHDVRSGDGGTGLPAHYELGGGENRGQVERHVDRARCTERAEVAAEGIIRTVGRIIPAAIAV